MNKKNIQIWLPVLLSVSLMTGMFFGYKLKDNMGTYGPSFFGKAHRTSLQEILDLVKQKYVDTVNIDSLGYFVIQDVMNQLDPHSVYIPAGELQQINEDMQGNFQGVGIEFGMINDTAYVMSILPKGPAETAGMQAGDIIISANDSLVSGKKLNEDRIKGFFRGPKGSEVHVKLLRNKKQEEITIQRGIIPLKSVDAAYIIEPGTGFIRLNKFSATTYEEFMENLERLQKEGMKKLILDLRGNGGGMLDDAVQIADEFLDGNKEIVYTEGKSSPRQDYTARRPGLFETGKLIVLIDEGSASASEVLAGALQDWDRATIMGRRSFGKGLVQDQFTLSDGSAIRLTVSRYYTPVGRSIQKPYVHGDNTAYKKEVSERFTKGEIYHGDSSAHNGKAYKTKGGRVVYGGGGISPNIYIPFDSVDMVPKEKKAVYREILYDASFLYYLSNKAQLKKIKTPSDLQQYTNADASVFPFLKTFAVKDSINLDLLSTYQQQTLKKFFASMVGRQLWRSEGYIKMKNLNDPLVNKALEEMRK